MCVSIGLHGKQVAQLLFNRGDSVVYHMVPCETAMLFTFRLIEQSNTQMSKDYVSVLRSLEI
jgi:hypothetical protein